MAVRLVSGYQHGYSDQTPLHFASVLARCLVWHFGSTFSKSARDVIDLIVIEAGALVVPELHAYGGRSLVVSV